MYFIRDGFAYQSEVSESCTVTTCIGNETYTQETDTEIITYQFDLDAGDYVEISRQPKPE